MEKNEYFKDALSNFTFEVASGGAIRHLANRGYTVNQIMKMLDFPTPFDRVQKTVWQHFIDTGRICLEEPSAGRRREKAGYVVDYDSYGRKSFRKIILEEENNRPVQWKTYVFSEEKDGKLWNFLSEKCSKNGEETAYVSCDFGLRKSPSLEGLEPLEREYIQGLFQERRRVWHRLDERMRKIICRLYEQGEYRGDLLFVKTGEKVFLSGCGDGVNEMHKRY